MIDKAKDNIPVTLLRYPPVVSAKILLTPNQHPITNSIRSYTSILILSHLYILILINTFIIFEMIILFKGVIT
jgi:hypothetical protein